MKPYTSKLINPDRYIDKLKGEIGQLRKVNKDHWRRNGVHEFRYKDGAAKQNVILLDPTEHPKLLPGTDVIFTGKVSEVHRTEEDGTIKFNIHTCKRVEPRE